MYWCVVRNFFIIYFVSSNSIWISLSWQNTSYVYIKNGKFTLYIYILDSSELMEVGFIHLLKCIFCKKK